jgi:hypothetical protein
VLLPDMSGPPAWWDALVLALGAVGVAALARRAVAVQRVEDD